MSLRKKTLMITAQLATETREGRPCAVIQVRDDGCGIAPEHFPNTCSRLSTGERPTANTAAPGWG